MKAAVLFSGGKDSCLALHIAKQKGYNIRHLLSVIPRNFDSFMFHKPDEKLLKKQAEMLGIELIIEKSKGLKEKELDDLKKLLKKAKDKGIELIIVGGIASNYQGSRVEKICKELELKFYAPLWDYDGEKIWKELFENNFKVILTKIACEGISSEFLGKIITREMFEKLKKLSEKYKFRLDFEGGEAESAVVFMPGFKKPIKIDFDIIREDNYRSYLKIKNIK